MTRLTGMPTSARLTRPISMNRNTRLPWAVRMVSRASIYRLNIPNSMSSTARHTNMRRMNKDKMGGAITME